MTPPKTAILPLLLLSGCFASKADVSALQTSVSDLQQANSGLSQQVGTLQTQVVDLQTALTVQQYYAYQLDLRVLVLEAGSSVALTGLNTQIMPGTVWFKGAAANGNPATAFPTMVTLAKDLSSAPVNGKKAWEAFYVTDSGVDPAQAPTKSGAVQWADFWGTYMSVTGPGIRSTDFTPSAAPTPPAHSAYSAEVYFNYSNPPPPAAYNNMGPPPPGTTHRSYALHTMEPSACDTTQTDVNHADHCDKNDVSGAMLLETLPKPGGGHLHIEHWVFRNNFVKVGQQDHGLLIKPTNRVVGGNTVALYSSARSFLSAELAPALCSAASPCTYAQFAYEQEDANGVVHP